MLSTLSISLPANLYFFFSGSVCVKTGVMAEQPVGKTSKLSLLSSKPVTLDALRSLTV